MRRLKSAGAGATIELKTRINRFDDESVRWQSSGTPGPCRNSLLSTPQSI